MEKPFTVALAIPLQGPGGIFGPSCELLARLAAERLNATDGIAGREVRLHIVDAGAPITHVRADLEAAARAGRIDAVTGWHISSVRETVGPALADSIPYVYTSLHEGGHTEGTILVGENPRDQVLPALDWLHHELGITRWAIVGSDYIWPRATAGQVRNHAHDHNLRIVREDFVPYGSRNFRPVIDRIRRSDAHAVLMLLVGRDALLFNRQFAAAGLPDRLPRFTPLMEENMLLASGHEATRNLFVAASYFSALSTTSALAFVGDYTRRFGHDAPMLNNAGESCYEGMLALAAAVRVADSAEGRHVRAAAHAGLTYHGPRGEVRLGKDSAHQSVYIARANGYEFDILASLASVG